MKIRSISAKRADNFWKMWGAGAKTIWGWRETMRQAVRVCEGVAGLQSGGIIGS